MHGRKPKLFSFIALITVSGVLIPTLAGCSMWRKSDESSDGKIGEILTVPDPPDLVREATVIRGLQPIQVDAVAAINALPGTGGPADPSSHRDRLLDEMKHNDVANPNQFLEQTDTALVLVRGYIPPAARRGDPIDLRITTPDRSHATDLRGGWLLDTRLRHQQMLDNSVRRSDVMAMATGHVLTRESYEPDGDDNLKIEGKVIGGGRVQDDRKLGLVLRPEFQHVKMSAAIAAAINRRFFFFDGTTRRGIAKAMEDDYIEIDMHPRYRASPSRLMAVIQAISVKPESSATQTRLERLATELQEPAAALDASLQLEALGESAIPTLLDAVDSTNPEIRFYAAQALAYLDRVEAIDPLAESAKSIAAFRQPSLTALQGMPRQLAIESLMNLFSEASLETRYGAFVSVRRRDDGARVLRGQPLGDSFWMYQFATQASPAIIVSLRERPEIVVFGSDLRIPIKRHLFGPSGIILKADPSEPGQIRISRFQAGKDDRRVVVPDSVAAIAQGIVAVGGGYGDVITVLRKAKDDGLLDAQLAIDPLPKTSRKYYRDVGNDDESEKEVLN